MIEKRRTYPIRLLMYEAIMERILPNHPKIPFIEQEYKAFRAGYRGELQTDYRLSFLPEKEYRIFQDLRLQDGEWFFQIDTLVLTPRYILLIETKNYSGSLFFDKFSEQMIQSKNQLDKSYDNPLNQVQMQSWHLRRWLTYNKIPVPPIEHLVVISNSSSIVKTSDRSLHKLVIKADVLFSRVVKIDKVHSNIHYTEKEIKKISKLLNKTHSPHLPALLKHHALHLADFQKGIQCPSCFSYGMTREKWVWRCPVCGSKSRTAHHKTVRELFLLTGPTIKNQDCREFCVGISSKTASDMLISMSLPYTGSKKGRIYHVPKELDTFFLPPEK